MILKHSHELLMRLILNAKDLISDLEVRHATHDQIQAKMPIHSVDALSICSLDRGLEG